MPRTSAVAWMSKRMAFAQRQQATDVVDVGVGQHHVADRTVARRTAGMQGIDCGNLLPDIGRAVQETPGAAVRRNRQPGLGAALYTGIARPGELTNAATAIPLRTTTTGGCPQHHNFHAAGGGAEVTSLPTGSSDLVLGRKVVVDFQRHADFFHFWFGPLHHALLDLLASWTRIQRRSSRGLVQVVLRARSCLYIAQMRSYRSAGSCSIFMPCGS